MPLRLALVESFSVWSSDSSLPSRDASLSSFALIWKSGKKWSCYNKTICFIISHIFKYDLLTSVFQPFEVHSTLKGQENWAAPQHGKKLLSEAPLVISIYKKTEKPIFGDTPSTFSQHPCVPRHPGWESLVYMEQ